MCLGCFHLVDTGDKKLSWERGHVMQNHINVKENFLSPVFKQKAVVVRGIMAPSGRAGRGLLVVFKHNGSI